MFGINELAYIIGAVCFGVGIWCIARKQFALEFGRMGFFRPKRIMILRLRAGRAILFGWVSFSVGLTLLGFGGYVGISHNQFIVEEGWLQSLPSLVGLLQSSHSGLSNLLTLPST
jgi:hypothetical protein